jgi:hypothetical protein
MEDQKTTYEDHYQHLRAAVESLEADVLKAQGGNKSAAGRVRKTLRALKKLSSEFVKFSMEQTKEKSE